MLFDLNGNKYMVKFYRIGTSTFARLYENFEINESMKAFAEIGMASAICNPKDRFNKSTGRKLVLHRLLTETPELQLSREDRTRIWEIYFKEHKK